MSNRENLNLKIEFLLEETEKELQELMASERDIKSYGLENLSPSIRKMVEKTLDRSKKVRNIYAREIRRLDVAKKRLEEI
jgi:hypothetical protein